MIVPGSSNSLMLGAEAAVYQIARSLRFRRDASAYMSRTPASAGNRTKWTWSGWVKRGELTGAGTLVLLSGAYSTVSGGSYILLNPSSINFYQNNSGSVVINYTSSLVMRDPAAHYHLMIVFDTAAATGNRAIVYINGTKITMTGTEPPLNHSTFFVNAAAAHYLGTVPIDGAPQRYFDGYLSEVNFIDGQALTPDSFGQTDPVTGVWGPKKYTGTYGTNGYYLNFSDNSGATATTIGKDSSGNSNNWTPTGISVTAGVTYDSMIDVPTMAAAGGTQPVGNYCVLNPLDTAATLSSGNLLASGGAAHVSCRSTMQIPTSGLWYAEAVISGATTSTSAGAFGVALRTVSLSVAATGLAGAWNLYGVAARAVNNNGASISAGGAFAAGDVLRMAIDTTNNRAWFGVNAVWYDSAGGTTGNPSAGTNPTVTGLPSGLFAFVSRYANSINANFGQRPFAYTPPTGFNALCTTNLPDGTIKKGNQYFDATLFTGTGSAQNIVNAAGFQPAFVWEKTRSATASNILVDAVRGATKEIYSDQTTGETTNANGITGFLSNGFSVGTSYAANTHVGWQWKNDGSIITNTSGSITADVKADPVAGFSIVTYTGNGVAGATIGHGLGVAPALIMIKSRTGAQPWNVYYTIVDGSLDYVVLNSTAAKLDSAQSNPTSSVFSVSSGVNVNGNGTQYVAYCFTDISGYSKIGAYTGNGAADGPFVYCGFRPKFLMIKNVSAVQTWGLFDSARSTYNVVNLSLSPSNSIAEATSFGQVDFLSNGFKVRSTDATLNGSGNFMLYLAFAENPFKNALAR